MTQSQIEIVLIDRSQGGGAATAVPLPPPPQQPNERWRSTEDNQDRQADKPAGQQPSGRTVADTAQDLAQATVELTRDTASLMKDAAEIAKQTGLSIDQARKLIEEGRISGPSGEPQQTTEQRNDDAAVRDALTDMASELKQANDKSEKTDRSDGRLNGNSISDAIEELFSKIGGNLTGSRTGSKVGGAVGRQIGQTLADAATKQAVDVGAGRVAGGAAAEGAEAAAVGAAGRTAVAGGGAATGTAAAGGTAATVAAVAAPIAVVVGGLLAFGFALKKSTEIANHFGDELEDVSPAVAYQRAQAEVARFQDRIDRGQRIGGAVSQVEAAQSRLGEASYELMTAVYDILAKGAPVIEFGVDTLTAMLRGLLAIKETVDVVATAGLDAGERQQAVDAQNKFLKAFVDVFRENDQQNNNDPLGPLMDLLKEEDRPARPMRPNQKPKAERIKLR